MIVESYRKKCINFTSSVDVEYKSDLDKFSRAFPKKLQLISNNANVISMIRNEQCAGNYSNQKIIEFIRCIVFNE